MKRILLTARLRRPAVRCLFVLLAFLPLVNVTLVAFAQDSNGGAGDLALKNVKLRSIGPAIMGGRIDDFAVVESNPNIIYAGAATGGVWKSENGGVTWNPVFDDAGSTSVGDVAIAPSDPNIIWVGTGEPNNRQSSSWGDGVYRSLDGGKTWRNMGLKDTKHIGRVCIDPRDPNIVYVAAVGHLWGPNRERGVFKTTDGGATWTHSLFVNEDTGVTDLAIDPRSPMTLYAAAYQRRRTPWGFNGGGPHSGLYRTIDGGATWKKLTEGLPDGITGRIGVDVYRANPNIVYALIENAKGGVFRSEDRGETWKKMSDTNHRPMYYSQIRIDPNNDQRIWFCGAPMFYSEDGGKTFQSDLVTKIHGDYHGLWIDPANSNHMLAGSDGGVHISHDRGRTWDYVNTIPLGQFYEISLDNRKPYWVYGGLQDNGSWSGPSATLTQEGITNDDWIRTGGGDGFYSQVDPTDPSVIYVESQNGNVARLEMKTGERRNIKLEAKAGEKAYRFDWNSPIVISSFNNRTIYYGGNRVFRSTDRGDSWTASGDLSKDQDRDKLPIMGVLPDKDMLSRHDGQETFGQIVTLAESPIKEGLLYAGTDDGNLHVSRDGGAAWKSLTGKVPGVPNNTYVSRVVPSRFAEGTVYAAFDGHRSDDYGTYLFVSADYGESWKPIKSGLPAGATTRVIREHPRNQNLLFLGSEFGAFVSFDRGGHWTRLKGNFPTVRVDDIQIHPRDNDLVLATHGRSIWVLDDITPLEQITESVAAADVSMFDIRPATEYRIYNAKGNTGHKWFAADNPPYGAAIQYCLKTAQKDAVKIKITDKSGKLIREMDGPRVQGLNKAVWDLRYPAAATGQQGGGGGGFFGAPRGPRVAPGEYTVTVSAAGKQASKPVRVDEDPRIQISDADRSAWSDAVFKVYELQKSADAARRSVQSLKSQVTSLEETLKKTPNIPDVAKAAAKTLADQIDEVQRKIAPSADQFGGAGPALPDAPRPIVGRLGQIALALESYTAAPTPSQLDRIGELTGELKSIIDQLNKLVDEGAPNLNKQLRDSGVQFLNPGQRVRSGN